MTWRTAWFLTSLWCVAATTVAVGLGAELVVRPDPGPVSTAGLSRFPVLDNSEPLGPVTIECVAWSNRPGFDVQAVPSEGMAGFRVVSDCRTVPA